MQEEQTQQWWNIEAIWVSVFKNKSKNQDTRAIFSACYFTDKICLRICRAFFLRRAFQFCFLNTVETLSFFSLKSSLEFVLHCEKFISLLATPLIYRSKFQLCTTARSIIIFMQLYCPVCLFFSKSGGRNNATYAFQNSFKNDATQYAKKKKKKRKNKVLIFKPIFAVGHSTSS